MRWRAISSRLPSVDAGGVDAELPGGMDDEPAPAATNVEQSLAGFEPQLLAQNVQLVEAAVSRSWSGRLK